jgi:hypothetical protein
MKKIILITVFGLMLSASSVYAAIDANSTQSKIINLNLKEAVVASRTATKEQIQSTISQDLKQRAQTEISRRLEFLNQLIAKINDIKKLSSAEKTSLQSQIQTQIDGLNALRVKINADTDNTTLKADVKSIISDYYIFLFFRAQVNLLVTADKSATIADNLGSIYIKLQTRINQAQTVGSNVIDLSAMLSDMNTQLTVAQTQITAVQAELTPLTAQGYPGNKFTLVDARAKLILVNQELKAVYQDAIKIRQVLPGEKIKNPEASTSAH